MIRLFDSHTHVNDDAFSRDWEEVIARALEAGVVRMNLVGYNPRTIRKAVAMWRERPDVFTFSAATHPHEASKYSAEREEQIREVMALPGAVAVGETGLDYFKDHAPKQVQQDVFRRHLDLAAELDKPVILHLRDAWEDAFRILEPYRNDLPGGVFHCFTGGMEEASHILEHFPTFMISFSGILTFRKEQELQEVARRLPENRILIETDAPFLTPVPHRGKRNEPAYLVHTFRFLTELRKTPPEDLARVLWENTHRVYGLTPVSS